MATDTGPPFLFAQAEKTTDLYALLEESDIVILPEVEPVFRATSLYNALCKMYSKRGDDAALLEVWPTCADSSHASHASAAHDWNRRLVEGEWTDPEIPDPLSDMFALLTARRNRASIQQWGVWLAGKDAGRALKVGQCRAIFFAFGYTSHERSRCHSTVIDRSSAHGSTKRGGR